MLKGTKGQCVNGAALVLRRHQPVSMWQAADTRQPTLSMTVAMIPRWTKLLPQAPLLLAPEVQDTSPRCTASQAPVGVLGWEILAWGRKWEAIWKEGLIRRDLALAR